MYGLKFSESVTSLVSLLKVLCDGSLEDFKKFQASNAAIFTKYSLSSSDIEHDVKLLTLCSLAANSLNKVLPYATVSSDLQIPEQDVEMWIIDAISSGLIDGAMDQLNSTITITQYSHRSFGATHWRMIQAKLRELRKNLSVVVDSMQQTNVVQN